MITWILVHRWLLGFDKLSDDSSLEKTDSPFLSIQYLAIPLHLGMRTCENYSTHTGTSTDIVIFQILLRVKYFLNSMGTVICHLKNTIYFILIFHILWVFYPLSHLYLSFKGCNINVAIEVGHPIVSCSLHFISYVFFWRSPSEKNGSFFDDGK